MRALILAGGLGTRISEETADKPKPMVNLRDKPILWHIMNIYAKQGISDFVIATGYKAEVISDWVANLVSDWKISLIDTGLETQTGGRIKHVLDSLPDPKIFATYGDGVANIDLSSLIHAHEKGNCLATLTAVHPPARFGYLELEKDKVTRFGEKNQSDSGWINGGFFVLEREVRNEILDAKEAFELGALPRLAERGELHAYKHEGFWQPMDTLREKHDLEKMIEGGNPPWLQGL
jgi:glucose-1-phosphate cytidylyltransferase